MSESERGSANESVKGTKPRVGDQFSLWSPQELREAPLVPWLGFERGEDSVDSLTEQLMHGLNQKLQSSSDLLGECVSALGTVLAQLEALGAEFSERLTLEGGLSHHDDTEVHKESEESRPKDLRDSVGDFSGHRLQHDRPCYSWRAYLPS